MLADVVRAVSSEAYDYLCQLVEQNDSSWTERYRDAGVMIESMKSMDPRCPEEILRCRNVELPHLLAIVSPWYPYRTQFDEMLLGAEMLLELEDEFKLIRHITKKRFPFAMRDSIDAVTLKMTPTSFAMVSRSVPNAEPQPADGIVRTYSHLGAYYVEQMSDGTIQFDIYFQCNLNISAPSMVRALIDKAKPRFMAEVAKSLRKACRNLKIDPAHIRADFPTEK